MDNINNIRKTNKERQLFRTPIYSTLPLLDRIPELTLSGARVLDPSAGDGRMIVEIMKRNNMGRHCMCEIASDEVARWRTDPLLSCVEGRVGDYLDMSFGVEYDAMLTNPPFTLAQKFVEHAKSHVRGPICILQSVAWISTQKRSEWLANNSGLKWMLNLPRRPRWEFDDGKPGASNIWDFAWYVFERDYSGVPMIDWLFES